VVQIPPLVAECMLSTQPFQGEDDLSCLPLLSHPDSRIYATIHDGERCL